MVSKACPVGESMAGGVEMVEREPCCSSQDTTGAVWPESTDNSEHQQQFSSWSWASVHTCARGLNKFRQQDMIEGNRGWGSRCNLKDGVVAQCIVTFQLTFTNSMEK